jgi:hypothetical protein
MKTELDIPSSSLGSDAFDHPRTSQECTPLLDSANLQIYRDNPFRITGLFIDASVKEIARHADKLKKLQELGHAGKASATAFALEPPPSSDQIRAAIDRLNDPERRLIDEFFWFWPMNSGTSANNDTAIQALNAGDLTKAYDTWKSEEHDSVTGFIANHNMAVMVHLIALDWTVYQINAGTDGSNEELISQYWTDCGKRWRAVPSDDRVWDAVKARIHSSGDPRLTTGFLRRFVETLPIALAKINADAALAFAEQNRLQHAKRQIRLLYGGEPRADDAAKAIEIVLSPLRKRILQSMESTRETTTKEAAKGGEAVKSLLHEGEKAHSVFDLFYPDDAHHKTELFDEVAAVALDCVIDYQRSTDNNPLFVEILRAAARIGYSPDLLARIEKNIAIGEGNIRAATLRPLYTQLNGIRDKKVPTKERLEEIKKLVVPDVARLTQRAAASNSQAETAAIENLVDALSEFLLDQTISVNVFDRSNDEIIIPAGTKITRILLRRVAQRRNYIKIDSAPIREKVNAVILANSKNFPDVKNQTEIDPQAVDEFRDAVSSCLRGLSIEAHNDEENFETAAEAIRIAVRLAKSPDLKKQCEADLALVVEHLDEFRRSQVHLSIGRNKVSVTRDSVVYNSQKILVQDVQAVRYGVLQRYVNGIPTSTSYLVAVAGLGANYFEIECKTNSNYSAIIEALFQNVIPKLVTKIVNSLKAGGTAYVGTIHKINKEGVYFQTGFFKKTNHLVPWSDIRYGFNAGYLAVSSASKGYRFSVGVRDCWNAVIFEPIIKTLLG